MWGAIREVGIAEIPDFKPGVRASKWQDLYDELSLRLMETPAKFALAVPFEDEKTADSARNALMRTAKREHGNGWLIAKMRRNGHGFVLYVHRGPEYK